MKKYLLILSLCILPLISFATSSTVTFSPSNATTSWTVPAGVTSILINVLGSNGQPRVGGSLPSGGGGSATGTLAVSPGQTYYIAVGATSTNHGTGGYPGGGNSGAPAPSGNDFSGGGGGMSWFGKSGQYATGTIWQSSVLLVGGGGGADGYGGGLTGGPGTTASGPGGGGTQSAGGACGIICNGATAGSAGQGGLGGTSNAENGGGGGGGWFGGGGGGALSGTYNGGGGGGSGFASSTLTATSTIGAINFAAGLVTITYTATPAPAPVSFIQRIINWFDD